MNAKADIMSVIAKTDDANMKVMLILMLAILEEIGDKIEAMRADEQGLRDAVLNGHSSVHDAHHNWITQRILDDTEEAKSDRDSKRKIRDGIVEWLIRLALVALAGAAWLK